MTFKEKYLKEHPEVKNWRLEVQGILCPHEVGYEPCEKHQINQCIHAMDCESCWDREMPEKKEHDGCYKCIHADKTEKEYPCSECRGTQPYEERAENEKLDYWESEEEEMNLPINDTCGLAEKHREICDKLNDIYRMKNAAYGNSFGETFKKLGLISAIIRISDKYNRLCTLATKPEIDTFDESIKDTILDMANYCIMTVMELDNE